MLLPPTIVTIGQLPELLYDPRQPVADDLRALLARMHALRAAPDAVLTQAISHPPEDGDLPAWLALAQDLAQLHETLAAEGLDVSDVAPKCAELTDFTETERWEALAELERLYRQALQDAGLQDLHAARAQAIAQRRCALGRFERVILLATSDLNKVTRQMLEPLGNAVTPLIHAPLEVADLFDEFGALVVERWQERELNLDSVPVLVADRPRDQAFEVLRMIETLGGSGKLAADQITIGLGDPVLAPMVQRMLDLAGVPARSALGKALSRSRPALLLAAVAQFLTRGQRFDDFAALVRHPDVESFLARQDLAQPRQQWLTLLDQYLSDHLQTRPAQRWLGRPEQTAPLKAVFDAVVTLTPTDHNRAKPLPQWSAPIAALLTTIYGHRALDRGRGDEADLIQALQRIGQALGQQAELDSASPLTPRLTLPQAVELTLPRLADQMIPPEGGPAAVELLGWLELNLDDAPALIVTGVNEGNIPQSVNADAFLPDRVRRLLGLADNRQRYARDLMLLTAIVHSRPNVTLIAGRRGADDDPLTPSRLLLARSADRLPALIAKFCADGASPAAPLLLQPAADGRSRFAVPPPRPPAQPLAELRVTAFRDYLACPYRFYLRHVLGLEALDDRAVEMDALVFGNLAHDVLREFARGPCAASTDPAVIARFFAQQLDELARDRFGGEMSAALAIQCQLLGDRLAGLAQWQAQQAQAGWRIVAKLTEVDARATLNIDGEPFTIRGRIDRIDVHPEHGHRILDYKSGDKARTPEQQHRAGPRDAKEWIDLQLPLYRRLAADGLGIQDPVSLGYVSLPMKAADAGWAQAPWDQADLQSAEDEAVRIIRAIRQGIFWPPTYPIAFADDFAGICMDDALDRPTILEQAARLLRSKGADR